MIDRIVDFQPAIAVYFVEDVCKIHHHLITKSDTKLHDLFIKTVLGQFPDSVNPNSLDTDCIVVAWLFELLLCMFICIVRTVKRACIYPKLPLS